MTKEKAQEIFKTLKSHYPHAKMILQWGNNFELLVAIILSAQCTDKKVNEVTARVFPKYQQMRKEFVSEYEKYSRMIKTNQELRSNKNSSRLRSNNKDSGQTSAMFNSRARMTEQELVEIVNFALIPLKELEQDIKSTGFYHNKAKSVQNAARKVLDSFNGILPRSLNEMVTIPSVGRKTANVFLTNAYHIDEGIAVDTHVTKQAQLLGLTKQKTPEKIEQDLMKLFPKSQWHELTYMLIEHGRNMRKKKSDRVMCEKKDCLLGESQ